MIKDSKKIYILGSVGSGKTTLAIKLSLKLGIPYYELDNVFWKYNVNGDILREDKERDEMFSDIINESCWIIEDFGRKHFNEGLEVADTIIFLDISTSVKNTRIFKRWFKQKIGLNKSRYKPTFKMLFNMYKWSNKFEKQKKDFLKNLEKHEYKLVIINEKNYEELFSKKQQNIKH